MATRIPEGKAFLAEWNALRRPDRLRIRRLVKLGRPLDDPTETALAAGYSRFQRTRVWARFFWIWFVPGVILALRIAAQIHPVLVGAVLALAAQAVFTHRNLRRSAGAK